MKKWNLPFTGRVHRYRSGTKRARLILMLMDGATFEECRDALGWSDKIAAENLSLLHTYVGFGLREDDDGRIYLLYREDQDETTSD